MTASDISFGRAAPGIPVRDIGLACAFYEGVLGFRKIFENGTPVGFVILRRNATELHLHLQRQHVPTTLNVAHILVDDAAALHAVCQSAGVRIIKSLADKEYGLRTFVFADPDGNRIDIGEPLVPTLLPIDAKAIRPFLPTRDLDRSRAFYEALGFQTLAVGPVVIFSVGQAGFILQRPDQPGNAETMRMQLVVDDLDGWWARIHRLDLPGRFGTRPAVAPAVQPWGLRVAFLYDPAGVLWHISEARRF